MSRRFAWLLLPSLLLPSPGASATGISNSDSPAVMRVDGIRTSLITRESASNDVKEDGKRPKLAQYWPNWGKWPNWGNFWFNR